MESRTEKSHHLFEVAETQQGYFTSADAKRLGYDYPHQAAWPYVEALVNEFGVDRLLWGSDFYPSIDHLSFPQTYGLFSKMPFLTDTDRRNIEGANLIRLIEEVA